MPGDHPNQSLYLYTYFNFNLLLNIKCKKDNKLNPVLDIVYILMFAKVKNFRKSFAKVSRLGCEIRKLKLAGLGAKVWERPSHRQSVNSQAQLMPPPTSPRRGDNTEVRTPPHPRAPLILFHNPSTITKHT